MLNILLVLFVILEGIVAVLYVSYEKSNLKLMRRNLNNDSYLCLGYLAKELYTLACKDLKISPDLTIVIHDLGIVTMGQTACDMYYKIVTRLIINPNQTLEGFIDTVLHETRHSYQAIITPELIFDADYISGVEASNFDAYYSQDIEIDAREYASKTARKYRREIIKIIRKYHKQNYKF
jgi:hypothetical protein